MEGWRQVWLIATKDTKSRGVLFHLHIYSILPMSSWLVAVPLGTNSVYIIYICTQRLDKIPGGSKARKLSFQATKCCNHTLSQLGLVSQASRLGWLIGLEHPLISRASMTVANWTQCCWHYSLNPGAWKGAVAYWLERISNCMWKVTFFWMNSNVLRSFGVFVCHNCSLNTNIFTHNWCPYYWSCYSPFCTKLIRTLLKT